MLEDLFSSPVSSMCVKWLLSVQTVVLLAIRNSSGYSKPNAICHNFTYHGARWSWYLVCSQGLNTRVGNRYLKNQKLRYTFWDKTNSSPFASQLGSYKIQHARMGWVDQWRLAEAFDFSWSCRYASLISVTNCLYILRSTANDDSIFARR